MANQSEKIVLTGEQTRVDKEPPYVTQKPADSDTISTRQGQVDKEPSTVVPPKDNQGKK